MYKAGDLNTAAAPAQRDCVTQSYRRLRCRGAALGVGVGLLLGTIVASPVPMLLWNASTSAPVGLYRIFPGAVLKAGDIVAAQAPDDARQLAGRRGYLPAGVPLVKRIAALQGSLVCAAGTTISVNGRSVAHRFPRDGAGRPMPWWTGCRVLGAAEYLLLNAAPASFDSRYFGPVGASAIVGKAVPLWLR